MVRRPPVSQPDWQIVLTYAFYGHKWLVPRIRTLARARLNDHLADWPDLIDDVTLVLTELMSNAIRHSRSGNDGGQVTVAIRRCDGPRARLEVGDEGGDTTPVLSTASPDADSGRGLHLVDALSDDWGVFTGRRHVVWATFTPPPRA